MDGFDAAAFAEEGARLLGIPLDPAFRTGVIANLERHAAAFATLVGDFAFADALEPAPVYRPDGERA